jgi:hypothetical protein
MKTIASIVVIVLLTLTSCEKVKNYFKGPETETLVETLHSATLTGYAANIAMAIIDGQSFSFVNASRSNVGFPCTTLMTIDLEDSDYPYTTEKASSIIIAGLWPDAETAVFSMIYTDYHLGTNTLELVGIETIPAIREAGRIIVALASQDIRFSPDQQSILQINLNTLQIESEFLRLDEELRPDDVYVAVLQNAYFIDINTHTTSTVTDDSYTVTGGGQLIEVAGNDAEIVQQAFFEVSISNDCTLNPLAGMALMKVVGLEDEGFPELGTTVLEFSDRCDGSAKVFAATGMYVGSNGRRVSFLL